MSRIPSVSLLVVVSLAIAVALSAACSQEPTYLTYENAAKGVKLSYPDSWEKMEGEKAEGALVAFLMPQESGDKARSSVNLVVEDLADPNMGLNDYSKAAVEEVKKAIPGISTIESRAATLSGNISGMLLYTIPYSGKGGETVLQVRQVFTLKNKKSYVVTFAAQKERYTKDLVAVQALMDSLQIR